MTTPVTVLNPGLLVQWGVGGLVVLLYARDRFDSPGPVRWTTTFARYWLARIGYMSTLLVAYLILAGAFTDAKPLWAFLIGQQAPVSLPTSGDLPGPLFAALLMTSFLPHIPYLKMIDEAAKRTFQRIGNIPVEVRILSDQLERAPLMLPEQARTGLADAPDSFGMSNSWFRLPPRTLTYRWARVALLYVSIKRWGRSPTYELYVSERKSSYDDLISRVESFRDSNEIAEAGLAADALPRNSPAFRDAEKKIEDMHRDLCDFIAGGLLSSGRSPKQRQHLLDEIGVAAFDKQLRPAMSIHHIFMVGGAIFLMVLFAALLFQQFVAPGELRIGIRILFMVPIIYCVSIVIAIYPKSIWTFADIRVAGQRPVMGYAASGAIAVIAAFVIQLVFRYVQGGTLLQIFSQHGSFTKALQTNLERWPWFLMTFFTTVAIAWAADDHYSAKTEPKWLRPAETLGMALVFGSLQWVTLRLLVLYSPFPERWSGRQLQMIVTSALVGACIGYVVPACYRTGCRRAPAAQGAVGAVPEPA